MVHKSVVFKLWVTEQTGKGYIIWISVMDASLISSNTNTSCVFFILIRE